MTSNSPTPSASAGPADRAAPSQSAAREFDASDRVGGAAWVLLLVVAFGIRAGAGLWWQSRLPEGARFFFGDSDSYWHLAHDLATGQPYQYGTPDLSIFRTPGYPLLLAPLFWLGGDEPPVWAARILNALLGTAAVAAVGWLAREATGRRRRAWLAAAIATVYPGAIATSVFVLSEAPFCPLLAVELACVLRMLRLEGDHRRAGARWAWSLASGVAGGLATLMRPSWLLFPVGLAGGMLLLAAPERRRARAVSALLVVLGLSAVMSPWWIRNARVSGHFVTTTLQLGASLYDGWSPTATGASDMRGSDEAYRLLKEEDQRLGRTGDFEWRLNRQLKDSAVDWAREHPDRAMYLGLVKLRRMWNIWPNDSDFRGTLFRLIVAAGYVPVITLALVGLFRRARLGWRTWLLVAPALYLTALHVIFVSSIRYREPAMLALIPLAVLGIRGQVSGIRG